MGRRRSSPLGLVGDRGGAVASRGYDNLTLCRQRGIVGVVDRVAGSMKLRAAAVLLLLAALLPLSFFSSLSSCSSSSLLYSWRRQRGKIPRGG